MQRIGRSNNEVRSRKMCSVPQCSSFGTSDISLHKFPLNPKAVKKWQKILKIGKPISKYMLVCSKHFLKEDFFCVTSTTQKKRLKNGSFPSQNLPVTNFQHEKIKDRSGQLWLRQKLNKIELEQNSDKNEQVELQLSREHDYSLHLDGNEHDNVMNPGETSSTIHPKTDYHTPLTHVFNEDKSTQTILPKTSYHTPLTRVFNEDKSTQTDFCDIFELPQLLNTDEKLSHFTGVSNKVIEICTTCTKQVAAQNDVYENNMNLWVILVFCKLKTNLSFACLAVLFGISNAICSKMFYKILSLLAISIKPAIYWPTKKEILNNMPICFAPFRNTRVVLDCTEVRVKRLKCLNCRITSYSHYKEMHIMKFLIGTTPSGLISYISPAYGGQTSDKSIFNNENLITKLDPSDAIMADKGVLIEEECQSHYVKLIQPPAKSQLSKEESISTAEIARARVHMERAMQQLKNFAILNDEIDWYLIPYIDDIMTVIAATVNMSRPVVTV